MSQSLEGATVLVTGGAGLIGSHIVDRLIDEDVGEIRVLDNLVRGSLGNLAAARARRPIDIIKGDVRDRETVTRAVDGCDFVSHQAAIRITLCAEQPRECMDVLVMGAFNVFEAAVASGVTKVVYASSASVYGAAEVFPTDERHHPYNNRTLYGAAKQMNEGIARSFHDMYGLASVGLRYFNVYGPRMDVTGAYTEVFIRWLECIDDGRPPQIHGDGSASMDFVYAEDIARANILAMRSDRTDDVYNVASGTETTLLGLWRAMQDVTGAHHLSPEFHPARKVNPVPRRLADTTRARRDLGFAAEVSLEEGLRRLVAWQRELAPGRKEVAR
ncbi:MAG: NAD-dependent epimerase/dehydratase family protein [Paludisphaera borealis]|uniref:NAD-dependent epimerase/dehydratase family protein n=1 Tax=Paludisphaera borealis TaxID=1387353 RepID=UPI0028510D41|nr:NAD-dependent epimerase/dehydratase family protein [Paludisphaera borealis]MDR3623147.1 NAD-dependent epimerase/dehydratase family protein [Paludisphaera borealis]